MQQYPLRTIAFVADLIFPPQNHDQEALQKVHGVVFRDAECRYQNFQVVPGGAQMANPVREPTTVSSCSILRDRIQVREEKTGISQDDFRSRVLRIAKISVNYLNIPAFIVRQFIIRTLVNPRNIQDSREFLAGSVIKAADEDFEPLEKRPDLIGLRLAFNAASPLEGINNIRIESFNQDPRSLFIENVATYRKPITATSSEEIGKDFDDAYAYVGRCVVPFIARFDQAP